MKAQKTLKFAFAQMNPTVGDYDGNVQKILDWIGQAESKGADMIVFPEMSVCGYPVWDLANKKGFVKQGLQALREIVSFTRGKKVQVVVGFIDRSKSGESYNAVAWISEGKIKAIQHKQLLPTYDVFLENIFFKPGIKSRPISWKHYSFGLSICEDIWDSAYAHKPLQFLAKQGVDFVINISASPFYQGISSKRKKLVSDHCRKYKFPLIYVNQVGAQDDLIFDGRSFFSDARGRILFECPAFEEGLYYYDWNRDEPKRLSTANPQSSRPNKEMDRTKESYQALVLGLRDYCQKNGFNKAVLGLSGGIDSALVASLAVNALGPKNVLGVTMPSGYSSESSWKDSEKLAHNLGMEFQTHSIRGKYEFMLDKIRHQKKADGRKVPRLGEVSLAMENLQARLRGLDLMFISNDEGRILLSTGNKSELAVGYCTLYGDMAGGLAVLGDVYKTDVYRLAQYRNSLGAVIPESILTKAPSAELRPNQKDQDSLPPYEVLDEVLKLYIEKNLGRDEVIRKMKRKKIAEAVVREIIRKTDHNEYKRRQTPPVLRITEKAWFGRRMPITNKFGI